MLTNAKTYLELHHLDTNNHTDISDNDDSYICIGSKQGANWTQKMLKVADAMKLPADDPLFTGVNKYFSLNSFYNTQRKANQIRHLRALYVDIDCYNVDLKPNEVAKKLQEEYFDDKIPKPNVILFSGRGVSCIWWIEHAPIGATNSWKRMNSYIYDQLVDFGADASCKEDTARVFRLPGSLNSKSHNQVYAYVLKKTKYRLGTLLEDYAPWTKAKREERASIRKKRAVGNKGMTLKTLASARCTDMKALQHLRNEKGVVDGYRATALLIYAYHKSLLINDEKALHKDVNEFNSRFSVPLSEAEVSSTFKYIDDKAEDWKTAYELKEFKKRKKGESNKYGLIFSNAKIIRLLDIDAAEQCYMTTLIGEEEKKKRERLRAKRNREKAGAVERATYLAEQANKTNSKLEQLRELLAEQPNAKRYELAEKLGVSGARITQLKKQL